MAWTAYGDYNLKTKRERGDKENSAYISIHSHVQNQEYDRSMIATPTASATCCLQHLPF